MGDNISVKEILMGLVKKVETMDQRQIEHSSYTRGVLEGIDQRISSLAGIVQKQDDQLDELRGEQKTLSVKVAGGAFLVVLAFEVLVRKFF